jgi:2-oxoisovalerate dehydrogenase E1 component
METNTTTNPGISLMEKVSALIEEQALTKEEMLGYLRQVMEIRALENNIANLLSKAVLKGASHCMPGRKPLRLAPLPPCVTMT